MSLMYSKRKNPHWLIRIAQSIGRTKRLIINYRYYRSLQHPHKDALKLARNTIY